MPSLKACALRASWKQEGGPSRVLRYLRHQKTSQFHFSCGFLHHPRLQARAESYKNLSLHLCGLSHLAWNVGNNLWSTSSTPEPISSKSSVCAPRSSASVFAECHKFFSNLPFPDALNIRVENSMSARRSCDFVRIRHVQRLAVTMAQSIVLERQTAVNHCYGPGVDSPECYKRMKTLQTFVLPSLNFIFTPLATLMRLVERSTDDEVGGVAKYKIRSPRVHLKKVLVEPVVSSSITIIPSGRRASFFSSNM